MAANASPIDFNRPDRPIRLHSARASIDAAAAETDGNKIYLPTLYSYIIERLEKVLDTNWAVVHGSEASFLEDMVLKLRLWAGERDLSSHENFATFSKQGQIREGLVLWTRDRLFEIDGLIRLLLDHADEFGYRSSPKRANTETKQTLASLGNEIETLTRHTSPPANRSSGVPPDSPMSANTTNRDKFPLHRTSTTSSSTFSLPSITTVTSRESYTTNVTSPDEELSPRKLELLLDTPAPSYEEETSPLEREITTNYLSADNILTICNMALKDLTTLFSALEATTSSPQIHAPSSSSTKGQHHLSRLHVTMPSLIDYISTLTDLYQNPAFPTSGHHLHPLMRETHLAHMIQSLAAASKPILSKQRSISTSSPQSISIPASPRTSSSSIGSSTAAPKSSIFDDIVLPAFAMHVSVAEHTLELALSTCGVLDTLDHETIGFDIAGGASAHHNNYNHNLREVRKQRLYAKKLMRETETKVEELDRKVGREWNERSRRMKSWVARSEVETHLSSMRGCWEYLILVCEWVVARVEEVEGGGGDEEEFDDDYDEEEEDSDYYDEDDGEGEDELDFEQQAHSDDGYEGDGVFRVDRSASMTG